MKKKVPQQSFWVLVANGALQFVLTTLKGIGGVVSGSVTLSAEALHSFCAMLSQIFLAITVHRIQRRADELHPFGLASECYFWPFIATVLLYMTGAVLAFLGGIKHILQPVVIGRRYEVLSILLGSGLLSLYSFQRSRKRLRVQRRDLPLFSHLRLMKKPEWILLFQQHIGALVGIALAAVPIVLQSITGLAILDGIGSLAIGILLFLLAFRSGLEIRTLIWAEGANPKLLRQVYQFLRAEECIKRILFVRSLQLAPGNILLVLQLEFDGRLGTQEISRLSQALENEIGTHFPDVKKIYIEPAFLPPASTLGSSAFS